MSNSPRKLTYLLVIAVCLIASFVAQAAPPVSTDDKASTQLNTPILIDVLSNDTSDDPLVNGTVNIKRPYRRGILALRSGQVRFTPKTGFVGDEVFSYTVRDIAGLLSNPATVTVTVNGDPTDIALSANTLTENNPVATTVGSFTTTDPNSADTHTYTLVAGAGSTDNASFQIAGSSLQTASVLDFETKSTYSIRVRSTDSGAGNLTFEKVFTITVTDLNEAPVFTITSATSVNEDAGAQTINAFATGINDGDAGNETLVFSVTGNTNALLFAAAPALSPTGVLTYTPAANANGSATISVLLTDSGSSVAPNVNQSAIQTFTITVNPVNDAPSFTATNPPEVNEDSGAQSIVGWASFNPGPNEGAQTVLSYNVSNISNPSLFSAAPSIANNGTLSYTPAPNVNGISTFDVVVQDNGTTANGGVDTSSTQTFTITVNAVNDAPVATNKNFTAQTNMKIGLTGLLAGVIDADNGINGCSPTFSVASIGNQVGGTFTLTNASTGAFDFDPNPGFTGSATATFTVQDNGCPGVATSTPANISVAVSGTRIWFVNAAATGGSNDGRLSNPFTSLASVDNVDTTNDRIFVFSGTYPTGLLTLFDGEQLIGQGVSGSDFDTLFSITPPVGTIARPSINGTRPTLQDTVTLANTNVVRGLNISTTGKPALADIVASISNVTVNEVNATSNSTTVNLSLISTGNIVLDSTTSTGGVNNISLSNVSATVNLGGGALSGSTAGVSNHAFLIGGGAGSISYSGSISKANQGNVVNVSGLTGGIVTLSGTINGNSSNGINVSSNSGGTINFSGASKSLNTGASTAITLSSNTGATVNLSGGGLAITTTSGAGFTATGGATAINVTGTGNTITSTTGTALNVANTTIGASGLTFQSISSNAAVNGIVLNNTGTTNGGLTVSGAGSAGSGGTIQNSTGTGILLTSTRNVVLNRMNITGNSDDGIGGTNVNGFVLDSCSITGNGNTINADSGVDMVNLTGTVSGGTNPTRIVNSTISNSFLFEIGITNNNAGTLTNLEMSGNTLSSNGLQPSHGNLMTLQALGNDIINLNVTSGAFTGNTDTSGGRIITATGLMCDHSGTGGTVTCNISNADFTNNNVGPQSSIAVAGNAVFNFNGNDIQGSRSHAVNFFADANSPFTKTLTGRPQNNIIGTANITGSGSTVGFPIRVQNEGRVPVTMAITGNTINESVGFTGINVNHGITTATGTNATNMTITGNNVSNIDSGRGVLVQQIEILSAHNAGTVCTDINGNTFSNIAGQGGDGTIIRIREATNNTAGPHNVRQLSPTGAVNANELDDSNGIINPLQISLSGTPTFGAGPCTQPTN